MSAKTAVKTPKENAFATINIKSFLTVVIVLMALLILCGVMTYLIPTGAYERDGKGQIIMDTFTEGEVEGIAPWRVLTAPFRVFFKDGGITVVMICLFLLIMSGIFNLLEKTGGVKIFMSRIIRRLGSRHTPVICLTVLIFMLFGSFFGMYEELITLLPIMILFMLSLGLDTLMGLGVCLMAACFGFSAAITNPFSVGLASEVAGIAPADGVWLRVLFFILTYTLLCGFLLLHLRRIKMNPAASLTYVQDQEKRANLDGSATAIEGGDRVFRAFTVFFGIQAGILVLIASVRAISDYAIPILAVSFLVSGIVTGLAVCERKSDVWRYIGSGMLAMLPAVLMIALASAPKLVMTESGILDTVMHHMISLLEGRHPAVAILLVYALTLFLQIFISSASAKIFLIMPIILPVAQALGLSPNLVILAYCMADGFTDVILPTNPILLIGLSTMGVSYGKWLKWTWALQLALLCASVGVLLFGVFIGY
jgi:uncharacterized ion transporter superfamily protein YfcC